MASSVHRGSESADTSDVRRVSDRSACTMSRNRRDECASDAMHDAYAARTIALGMEAPLAVGATNGPSRGKMYSENRYALTGDTACTISSSCASVRTAATLTESAWSFSRIVMYGRTRSSLASSDSRSENASRISQALTRADDLDVLRKLDTMSVRKTNTPPSAGECTRATTGCPQLGRSSSTGRLPPVRDGVEMLLRRDGEGSGGGGGDASVVVVVVVAVPRKYEILSKSRYICSILSSASPRFADSGSTRSRPEDGSVIRDMYW